MPKSKAHPDNPEQRHLPFFDPSLTITLPVPTEGKFDLSLEIKTWLSRAIKAWIARTRADRYIFASLVASRLKRDVGRATIDSWCSPSHEEWRVQLDAASAICEVLEDWTLFDLVLKPSGKRVACQEENSLTQIADLNLKLAEMQDRCKQIQRQKKRLERAWNQAHSGTQQKS